MARESHLRSILKGISWRFLATGILITIVYLVSGDISSALSIGATEFIVKLAIYYAHERGWAAYLKDREQTKKISLFKTIVWRIIASLTSLSIVWSHLQSGGTAGLITAIEFVAKFVAYYLHERVWQVLPIGTVRNLSKINRKKTTS